MSKHKVSRVVFAMLRTTKQYENDRAECVVDLQPGATQEDIEAAYAEAKKQCSIALGFPRVKTPAEAIRDAKRALDAIPLATQDPRRF